MPPVIRRVPSGIVHWYVDGSLELTALTYTAWRSAPEMTSSRRTVHPEFEGTIVASALVATEATSTSPTVVPAGRPMPMVDRLTDDWSWTEPTTPIPLPDGGGGGGGRVGGVPGASWHDDVPESVNVWPATGVNSQL